ncbi:MAG TPA: c-type cytochrome [Planctomycetota bacterium]|nr:c-type cytochrome [Planctomycetota bacterium]
MAETQPIPPDPIRTTSLALPIAVSTALLLAATGWAIYDEAVHKRPYLDYQDRFVESFRDLLDARITDAAALERQAMASKEYAELTAEAERVRKELEPDLAALKAALAQHSKYFDATSFQFRERKGRLDEYVNRIESATSDDDKKELRAERDAYRKKTFTIEVPGPDGAPTKKEYDADSLIDEYLARKAEQGRVQSALGTAQAPIQAAQKKVDAFMAGRMRGLSNTQLRGLRDDLDDFERKIYQIHVGSIDLVDRCESCHLGARQPMDIAASDMGGERAFVSHPNKDLLAIHDPEKFGCSLCHGGNGVAVTSVDKAHGNYKHWLWPLHDKENVEAGCVDCHRQDITLAHGGRFNHGKEVFRDRGCWGCHRYEGFDREGDLLTEVNKELQDLATRREAVLRRKTDLPAQLAAARKELEASYERRFGEELDEATSERLDEERRALIRANMTEDRAADQELTRLRTRQDVAAARRGEVYKEIKKVGPNLKEAKAKLKPAWIPEWIPAPEKFRPDTKMPSYGHLSDEVRDPASKKASDYGQVQLISAFVWNRALPVTAPKAQPGDAALGKTLFLSRGCTACHSASENGERLGGGDWAADLTRVAEKANYDYVVHWVQHPRTRLAPFSFDRKRDLLPEDFAKAGVPYAWDMEHGRDPETGGRLLAHNFTAMPELRLSDSDARDIATWLMSLSNREAFKDAPEWLLNPSEEMLREGERWTKHFGCAGCHEIAGLEAEQRIGVELTVEGSKPMERLDFGLLTHEAMRPHDPNIKNPSPTKDPKAPWYDHQGFFMGKLKDPRLYDHGKERGKNDVAALRMPNFRLSDDDRTSLTTFLLGSTDPNPRLRANGYVYDPEGPRDAVQEGWWVVKKYNCQACHEFLPGETPEIWTQPVFQKEATRPVTSPTGEVFVGGKDRRPPTLVTQGHRTDPKWLAAFLKNPALSETHRERNGVRPYLNVRMPTFHLSDNEVQKLVAFFAALSHQPLPQVEPSVATLSAEDVGVARELFTLGDCAKCHAKDDKFDPEVFAPSFALTPARLNPDWVERWIQDPQLFDPGTRMPALFNKTAEGHWRLSKTDVPAAVKNYRGDHVDLLKRFLYRYNEYAAPQPERR